MEKKKLKAGMFSRIESREDALKMIKDTAIGFFFIAAIEAVIGCFFVPSLFFDAFLYAILATVLLKWKSRISAILLLLVSMGALAMTLLNMLGVTEVGGVNIVLALLIFWAAIRSVEATFKLQGKFYTESI